MSRPTTLIKDKTLYWVIRLYNDSQVLVDADSTPTVAVRKNDASVGDSVTVTKRAATTGIYDCQWNPSGEVEGDQFILEESATVSSVTYENSWSVVVEAAERGTDNAILASSAPTNWSLMAINGSGEITTSNPASGGGSAHTAEDVRDLILAGDKTPITMAVNKVSNVVLVDTTTANTDMRGTNGANTVAPDNASIADILADTNELQSNQGDWATADTSLLSTQASVDAVQSTADNILADTDDLQSNQGQWLTADVSLLATQASVDALNDFDPATDTVANVTNVAVCASNTDMVGTDNALLASSAPTNWSLMAINGSGEITTSNPASGGGSAHTAEDVRDLILAGDKTPITMAVNKVSNVVLVDTTTTNTDMRGTNNANTVAPDNTSIADILADTNELQQNQGDWATATGFSTFNPATDPVANVTTVGSVTGAVTTDTASREASKATGFSTFDPATDTVANVTNVAVCASNTDMVGTDNALLASAAPTNWSIMAINGSGEITTSNPASGGGSAHTAEDVRDLILGGDKTPIAVTTGSVNNVILVDTTTDLTNGGSGGGDDAATIYAYFTDVGRPVPFQADVSGLSTFDSTTDQVVASNFVAPDNAGIAANGLAIAALNDFDPATDVVANVTLVDTTTDLTNQATQPGISPGVQYRWTNNASGAGYDVVTITEEN